ncbi:MAG: threonine/serine exporter family protein [Ruminococcaceae bacterium]|nr:threonine/serine exporter family protein [Oscillospiraceae bacterium]
MENRTCINLLLTAGQLLLESGAETYRAEDAALYMFKQIGEGDINIVAVPTMLMIEIITPAGESVYGCRRIRRRSTHLGKLAQINTIVRRVTEGELIAEDALCELQAIDQKKESAYGSMLATAAAAGVFALLIDGGVVELIFAFSCCLLAQIASLLFSNVSMYGFFSSVLGGLVPTLVMIPACRFIPGLDPQIVLLGSMLPLFPGVATVNAIRDTINGDLISGVSRAAEAVLIALGLGLGASLVLLVGVV